MAYPEAYSTTPYPLKRVDKIYNFPRLLSQWNKIKHTLEPDNWYRGNQTMVQYSEYDDDIWTDGCGSLTKRIHKRQKQITTGKEYCILNPLYEGTIFEEIINDLDGTRARVLIKEEKTAYSHHQDPTSRCHVALETNSDAFFVFPKEQIVCHIPADGCAYKVDTTRYHTFVNCGADRVHLVFDDYDKINSEYVNATSI